MKLDVTPSIKNIDGSPLSDAAQLRTVIVNALLATFPDELNLSGEDKIKRYELALAVQGNDVVSLKVEDAALVKKLVAKAFAPLVVGQVWRALEAAL